MVEGKGDPQFYLLLIGRKFEGSLFTVTCICPYGRQDKTSVQ